METRDYDDADQMVLGTLASAMCVDVETQRYLIEALAKVGCTRDWFRDGRHQKFFDAVQTVWRERQQLDAFIVSKAYDSAVAEEWPMLYEELMNVPTAIQNFEYYLGALRNKHLYTTVRRVTVKSMAEWTPDNIGIMLEDFVKRLHQVQENVARGENTLRQLGDFAAKSIETKRKLHEERFVNHNWDYIDGLRWPWKQIDGIFCGLKKGLHIVAALASQGKSTMAVNLSAFWNETGVRHGFFSIDMAADQLADRYPCVMNRVSLAKLAFGASKKELAAFEDGFEKSIRLNNVWISEMDDAKTIEYQCYRGVKTLGWKAVIIDYIQLVHPDEKGNLPEYTKIQHAVQAVKRIAKKLEIPVICLAQLSRQFERDLREKGFAPGLDAIGDSAEIARAAASVTCLYQDEGMRAYWAQTPPTQLAWGDKDDAAYAYGVADQNDEDEQMAEQRRNGQVSLAKSLRPVWFDVKKNQQGRCGKIPFVMFPHYFLFRPGDSDGGSQSVLVGAKEKTLPVGQFEHLCDDWTFAENDWWLEMTGVMQRRGTKLAGETYAEMWKRLAEERQRHPEVRHFVRDYDTDGRTVVGHHWQEAAEETTKEEN